VIIQIFVTQSDGNDPLFDQLHQIVVDALGIPKVGEALGKSLKESPMAVEASQKQPSGIGCDRSTIEIGHNFSGAQVLK
jgi:hypothetical protein